MVAIYLGKPGPDGNKLAQVWKIAHHLHLSCFRHAINVTLDRTFFGVRY